MVTDTPTPENDPDKEKKLIGGFVLWMIKFFTADPKMMVLAVTTLMVGHQEYKALHPDPSPVPGMTQEQLHSFIQEEASVAADEAAHRAVDASDNYWATQFSRLERKVDALTDKLVAEGVIRNAPKFADIPRQRP
jgi:hypothetical protein